MNKLSHRGKEWIEFSEKVLYHIENYTVPQYGDKGHDNLTEYSPHDCMLQVKKYGGRHGKNQRENQERLDMLKAAHYAQVAWTKTRDEEE